MRPKGITVHVGPMCPLSSSYDRNCTSHPAVYYFKKRRCAMLSKSIFHIRWSSAWSMMCQSFIVVQFRKWSLIWKKLNILQIDVQLNIKIPKAIALSVNIQSRFWLSVFL